MELQKQQTNVPAQNAQNVQETTLKGMLMADATKRRFNELLGSKAAGFTSSILSLYNSNAMLKTAEPMSIMNAAVIAASLDLPINPNLGFAAIVPYRNKGVVQAQFQLMYKGLIELCMRSGQFLSIIDEVVYEGQLITKNRFTGEYAFDEDAKTSDKVIGYMAYFKLLNGFAKTLYMSKEQVEAHALEYSQSYRMDKAKGWTSSVWSSNFDVMARKTLLKLLLSKYAPKSIEIQRAVIADQAVAMGDLTKQGANIEDASFTYVDNEADKAQEVAETIETKANQGETLVIDEADVVDTETGEVVEEKSAPKAAPKAAKKAEFPEAEF